MLLICGDVIRPGAGWLLRCSPTPRNLAAEMARTRDPAAFARLEQLCQAGSVGSYARLAALDKIAVIMAAKGGLAAGITVGDCAELLGIAAQARTGTDRHSGSTFFYQLLRSLGAFGEDAPATMRVFGGRGQPTCEQLIDRYHIRCRPVRDVLVDYLAERQAAMDFSSLQHYAYLLGKLFWRSTSTSPNGPTTTRPAGGRTRSAARSPPAKPPTRKTGCNASPEWTSGPGSGCRSCPPWSPGQIPSGPPPRNGWRPPPAPNPVRCSPPAGRRCAGQS